VDELMTVGAVASAPVRGQTPVFQVERCAAFADEPPCLAELPSRWHRFAPL
jgi:hypothetical protein